MVKSTCKSISIAAINVCVFAAIRVAGIISNMRHVPSGYGLRQPYINQLHPLLLIIFLAIVTAVGFYKLADPIDAEVDFLLKKSRKADTEIEEMKKEINALRNKIDELRKVEN